METLTLKNRKGQTIVGVLAKPEGDIRGTCIIQHGWGGKKEQAHMQVLQDAFLENGFQTFNFDATNSFNESDGDYAQSSLGLHFEDFEDVVAWAKVQVWYKAPLALTGHSKGGYSAARYAEDHPNEVALVVPFAPVISGTLSFEAYERAKPGELAQWKKDGVLIQESATTPGLLKHSPWTAMEERLNHDLLVNADKLTMPILLLVGSNDSSIPPDHVRKLFDAIPEGQKWLEVIKGASHTPREAGHLQALHDKLAAWLREQGK